MKEKVQNASVSSWEKPRGITKSTAKLKHHLETKHPDKFKEKLDAEKEEEEQENRRKRKLEKQKSYFTVLNSEASPSTSKAQKIDDDQGPKKTYSIFASSGWNDERTKTMDRKIFEYLITDFQPFSAVEDIGFCRLMNFVAPGYKQKGRRLYSDSLLPEIYNSVLNKIKKEVSQASKVSFTTDEWVSKNNAHSLLALTAHFLDINFQPKFFVLDCRPIEGSHIAENYAKILNDTLDFFELDANKVHLFLRDAQSTMKKATRLMNVNSFDCLAHKLQLAVRDGFKSIDDFQSILEKAKKAVRKIRKSRIMRDAFKEQQRLLDLPERMLVKECEVRWNTIYLMMQSLLCNRRAISNLSQIDAKFPSFDEFEWNIMQDITTILEPIFLATKEIENRRCSIASFVPISKTIIELIDGIPMDMVNLNVFRQKISNGIKKRMAECGWEEWQSLELDFLPGEKRNCILAISTMLDPRFKMERFEEDRISEFRILLENEAIILAQKQQEKVIPLAEDLQCEEQPKLTGFLALMQRNKVNIAESDQNPENNRSQNVLSPTPDPKTLAIVQVAEYLSEPVIALNGDPFNYWKEKSQAGKWDLLCQLAMSYLSAPCGSVESERLFSKAGLICTDLRNRLKSEKLRKILFLNSNLPIIDYDY